MIYGPSLSFPEGERVPGTRESALGALCDCLPEGPGLRLPGGGLCLQGVPPDLGNCCVIPPHTSTRYSGGGGRFPAGAFSGRGVVTPLAGCLEGSRALALPGVGVAAGDSWPRGSSQKQESPTQLHLLRWAPKAVRAGGPGAGWGPRLGYQTHSRGFLLELQSPSFSLSFIPSLPTG